MPQGPRDDQERYQKELHELQTQIRFLEDETALLRRRLSNAPRQVKILEERLLQSRADLSRALGQNEKLVSTLKAEREKLEALKEEVEKLTQPPATFGVFIEQIDDNTVDVFTAGRKMRVNVDPTIEPKRLRKGVEVILNEALNVVEVLEQDTQGEVVTVKEHLADDRVITIGRGDESHVATLSEELRDVTIRVGDALLYDPRSGYVLEKLPKQEIEELVLEEIPDISYEDIGGLERQIEEIRDAVELPFLYAELFMEHQLKPPKGVLLYGPPGCGKTLIAKAVAKSLAEQVRQKTGREDAHSYFLNVKGPELLNKYVGETERQIRLIFQRAKEKSDEGFPVIVFFDEMDSLFRTRGSGISSDVENTIVPQLLSEIDGVEILYFKDFNSGAMIENIVRRAKKEAIKRFLQLGEKGIRSDDLVRAIRDEFKENEDLPNTTNPDDWARISGKKGERIVYVRTLLGDEGDGRQVERVNAGQYL